MSRLKVLLVGDVVGVPGRMMFQKHIPHIKAKYGIDAIIVNGENSTSQGRGITSRIVKFFRHCGADVVTTGNHIWYNKEIYSYLSSNQDLLRPANFPSGVPGVGVTTFMCKNQTIAVINLQGRVFMKDTIDCPFRTAESILTYLKSKTNIIFVDFHAETTSEKIGIAHFLDGLVTGVVGTHTHVQTADERILPKGTGFITDLGMVGALDGMLGMQKAAILENFLHQMPVKFSVETEPPFVLSGVIMEVDTVTGRTVGIERVRVIDTEPSNGSIED
ncbi:MAG: TIGR00282 family metallophosphoesterase [Candidatus Dependentiae bacterium]|nr:TIGR00282 family metallophosphoesterase [Candidatus Dependentiae bacterium]